MGLRTAALAALLVTACSAPATDGSSSPAVPPNTPSSTAAAPERTLDQRAADAEADAATYDGIVTGISIALVQDGELRTMIHGPAVDDPDQRFMVASVSKPMVAAAVLTLVGAGDLALDDTVEELAPGLLPRSPGVTVEQLLSMSSGLADYADARRYRGPFTTSSADLVALVAQAPPEFPPGAQGDYHNTNFAVLDVLVQQVTGHSLPALLERTVVGPLHLRHTSLDDRPDLAGTDADDQPYRPRIEEPSAAGGIVASAGDVARFLDALASAELLPPELVADMEADHAHLDFGTYGLGLTRDETPCGTAYGHVGNNDGFEAAAWTVPEQGRTVVALVNAADVEAAQSLVAHALCD